MLSDDVIIQSELTPVLSKNYQNFKIVQGTADDELWPMIQNKLNVLSKVGLGNENFVDSETANVQHKATRYRHRGHS